MPRRRSRERAFESIEEHLKILQAIEDRDGGRAKRHMGDHLRRGLAYRTRLLPVYGGGMPMNWGSRMETPNNSKAGNAVARIIKHLQEEAHETADNGSGGIQFCGPERV